MVGVDVSRLLLPVVNANRNYTAQPSGSKLIYITMYTNWTSFYSVLYNIYLLNIGMYCYWSQSHRHFNREDYY